MVGHKRSLASGFRFCSFGGCEEGGNVPDTEIYGTTKNMVSVGRVWEKKQHRKYRLSETSTRGKTGWGASGKYSF